MSRLTSQERKALPASAFVFPQRRAYPIDTPERARNALARGSQLASPSEKREICRRVMQRYPDIHAESCPIHRQEHMGSHVRRAEMTS